jgi:DNA-binding transcriptional regulator/RsmH inhibitor MraZ
VKYRIDRSGRLIFPGKPRPELTPEDMQIVQRRVREGIELMKRRHPELFKN